MEEERDGARKGAFQKAAPLLLPSPHTASVRVYLHDDQTMTSPPRASRSPVD